MSVSKRLNELQNFSLKELTSELLSESKYISFVINEKNKENIWKIIYDQSPDLYHQSTFEHLCNIIYITKVTPLVTSCYKISIRSLKCEVCPRLCVNKHLLLKRPPWCPSRSVASNSRRRTKFMHQLGTEVKFISRKFRVLFQFPKLQQFYAKLF